MNLATKAFYDTVIDDGKPNTDATHIASVNARIASVSAKAERYLRRKVEAAEYTETFAPERGAGTISVQLRAYPVTEIALVKVYDSTYVENSDFRVDYENGVVTFVIPVLRDFRDYSKAISVQYTGGMSADTASFIESYPDIATEVCVQAFFELSRQKNIANKSTNSGAGIVTTHNPYGLQPGLLESLEPYVTAQAAI